MPLPDDPIGRHLPIEGRSAGTAASDSDPNRDQARPDPNQLPTQAAGLGVAGSELASDFDSALDLHPSVFRPGEVVAERFRIVRYLARGGMGELYEAEDLELHERVALKTILPKIAVDERLVHRFKREVHLARQVTHPNVCRIFDVYHHKPLAAAASGQGLLLAMELLHGESLADRLRREGRLSPAEALPLVRQMAYGLAAAHRVGVVHRDFKSQNVMLVMPTPSQQEVRAVITDFGLAQHTSQEDRTSLSMSDAGEISGTPAYMAPEQVEGGPVTSAADIYALGVVMYEMVTGVWPFVGNTPLQTAIKRLQQPAPTPRIHLPDLDARWEAVILRCLERDPANRFTSTSEVVAALEGEPSQVGAVVRSRRWKWIALGVAGMLVLAVATGVLLFRSRPAPVLSATDTVVVADFANSTGDAVFDDTLKHGLAVSLEQSPFWTLLPDRRVRDTLKLMGRSADERLTSELALDLCQRAQSKAVIAGSIASLGSQYVLGLDALNCQTDESLARQQVQAARKEDVLAALDQAVSKLRKQLGESLATIQKYDTPISEATTPSLEALKAHSLGRKTRLLKGDSASIPLFRRAIELDPNFAMAYLSLGTSFLNLRQYDHTRESIRKAYELRSHVSEYEKLNISASYHAFVTGELEKAIQVYEQWSQAYPQASVPITNRGVCHAYLGQFERAVADCVESIRINPNSDLSRVGLSSYYCQLNRLDEAKAVYRELISRKVDHQTLHVNRYGIAFLESDTAEMERQVAWAAGKPGVEDILLSEQSSTEAYRGRLEKARELSRRTIEAAIRSNDKEGAGRRQTQVALREAEFGNTAQARKDAAAALALSSTESVQILAALASARAGDMARAQQMADALEKEHPVDTVIMGYWLPSIRAAIEIGRKNPAKAIDILKTAAPFELGLPNPQVGAGGTMYPVWMRGQAYLMLQQGKEAAVEFQKFIDHRGIVINYPLGALAHLGLARAYKLQGDKAKAQAAYQEFLTLWKDADPDIPILKQAKAEAASVH